MRMLVKSDCKWYDGSIKLVTDPMIIGRYAICAGRYFFLREPNKPFQSSIRSINTGEFITITLYESLGPGFLQLSCNLPIFDFAGQLSPLRSTYRVTHHALFLPLPSFRSICLSLINPRATNKALPSLLPQPLSSHANNLNNATSYDPKHQLSSLLHTQYDQR